MNCQLCGSDEQTVIELSSCEVNVCRNCTLQFIDEQTDNNYYQGFYEHFDLNNSEHDKLRKTQYSLQAEHLKKTIPSGKILDVGCSSGELLSNIVGKPQYSLYGIDPDKKAISQAKKKFGSEIQFFDSDLIHYETDIKYDGIVFRGTLQYLGSDLRMTMEKISKIFSSNGKMVMYSIPNSDSIQYYLLKDKWQLFHKLEHRLIFNRCSILKLCEIFKYKLIELSYPYLETPYANPEKDYEDLINLIKEKKIKSFPFWGNSMQIVLQKL